MPEWQCHIPETVLPLAPKRALHFDRNRPATWAEIRRIPFVLVGVYFIVGRFFVDARMRSNTYYGLTDRRVLILSGLTSRSVQSTPLRTLHEIGLSEKSDRSGTIVFGSPHPMAAWYQGFAWPGMRQYQTPSFEGIADARAVHSEILNAQRAAV